MKKILILLAAAALYTTTAHAQTVYKCPGGRYTSEYYSGCTTLEGGEVGSYTASQPSGTYTAPPAGTDNTPPQNRSNTRAQRIAEAERALEEGRKTRLGNERNYAKYQERIRELEQNLERAKQGK